MKSRAERKSRAIASEAKLRKEIARFEAMTPQEIDDQLRQHGISPQETIATVTELVHVKLEEWRLREGLHAKKKVAVRASCVPMRMNLLSRSYTRPACGPWRGSRCLLERVTRRFQGATLAEAMAHCPCARRRGQIDA